MKVWAMKDQAAKDVYYVPWEHKTADEAYAAAAKLVGLTTDEFKRQQIVDELKDPSKLPDRWKT